MGLRTLCHHHAPQCHRYAAQQQPLGPARRPTPRTGRPCRHRPAARLLTVTAVAAVEDAPSTSAPAPEDEDEEEEADSEFANAMDFTNVDDLYARFNQLLDAGVADFHAGDKITGVIATCATPGWLRACYLRDAVCLWLTLSALGPVQTTSGTTLSAILLAVCCNSLVRVAHVCSAALTCVSAAQG